MKLKHALSLPAAAGLLSFALSAVAVDNAADAKPLAKAAAPAAKAKPAAAKPAAASSVSYSAGLSVGEGLRKAGVTHEIDIQTFGQGLKDALAGKSTSNEDKEQLAKFMTELHNSIGNQNHAAAKEFLAANAKAPGVVTTASGLQYKVAAAGDAAAASPQQSDEVTVQYRGRLLDGTEFDSSYSRGQPATFPLGGVIKGWQEALGLMKPGAKWTIYIPPELGYDLNSRAPIPPGSALVFDVELISVKAATAAAAPTGQ
ncbi:MAG: FKBP-type peptidyl-prolyl cis-trans isomerase [Pseudomonadota bacterium]